MTISWTVDDDWRYENCYQRTHSWSINCLISGWSLHLCTSNGLEFSLWSLRYVSSTSVMTGHIPRCIPLLVRVNSVCDYIMNMGVTHNNCHPLLVRVIAVRWGWHFSRPRVLQGRYITIRIPPYGPCVGGVQRVDHLSVLTVNSYPVNTSNCG